MTGGNVDVCTTHIIYVWYIYLRLVDFYGKWLYHTWMLWAMSMFYWMRLAVWLKLLCWISPEPEELQERIRSSRLSDIFWYIYIYSIKQICRSNLSVSCGLAITCYSQDLVKGDIFCWIELLSQPIKCHVCCLDILHTYSRPGHLIPRGGRQICHGWSATVVSFKAVGRSYLISRCEITGLLETGWW